MFPDTGNKKIRKIDLSTGEVTTLKTLVSEPHGLGVIPDGSALIVATTAVNVGSTISGAGVFKKLDLLSLNQMEDIAGNPTDFGPRDGDGTNAGMKILRAFDIEPSGIVCSSPRHAQRPYAQNLVSRSNCCHLLRQENRPCLSIMVHTD